MSASSMSTYSTKDLRTWKVMGLFKLKMVCLVIRVDFDCLWRAAKEAWRGLIR